MAKVSSSKHDLTLSPLGNDDESDSHPDNHDVPMATGVMPTLHPKPQLKFPKLPVQTTQQKDSDLHYNCLYVDSELSDSMCK